jgi:phosphoribosyl 1,2-cyclic phosphodiesterase
VTELTFLGTVSQLRQTGGLYLRDQGLNANIDPGPGALVHMHRYGLDPTLTDALLVSHAHPDHCTDTAVLIEGITRGGLDRRGQLVASASVTEGCGLPDGRRIGPLLTPYHLEMMAQVHTAKPGDKMQLGMYELTATKQFHSDPSTIGFKLRMTHGQLSYIIDTAYDDELVDWHKGSRVVVCQMTRGGPGRIPWHMCTDDVQRLAEQLQPRLLLLTHFGYKTLKEGDPGEWAHQITEATGVPTVAARDGLRVTMGSSFEMELLGGPQPVPVQV